MVNKIKVMGAVFDIELVDELKDFDNSTLWGDIQYSEMKIRIANKLHKRQISRSILHEIFHAMSVENELNWNEKTVTKLSNIMFCVLIDNKQFFKDVLNGS